MQMSNIVIIPAKSNSVRIKNKNFKYFLGKKIIFYAIENAIKSKLFDKIHISTDNKKISKLIKKKYKIKSDFLRPKKLCKINTSIDELAYFTLKKYEKIGMNFENFIILYATSPLISYNDLKKAFKIFKKEKYKYPLISVSKEDRSFLSSYHIDKKNKLVPNYFNKLYDYKKNIKNIYFDTGDFAIFNKKHLKKKLIFKKFLPYILPKYRSCDINNNEDWIFAEYLYKKIN
jgi:N-acylneuraminate cytidylyltransferase